jgi:hypothetical protein
VSGIIIENREEESSFSEEKEAKRLLSAEHCPLQANGTKVFWFFFSKKNAFLAFLPRDDRNRNAA